MENMEYIHKPKYIAAIVTTCVVFAVTMVFNGLAGSGAGGAIFLNTTSEISRVYYTSITPAGWAFSIWGVIYAWQTAWLIYGISTIFRKTSYGYLYIAPGHMHPSVYLLFTFNLLTNISWLVLWGRQYPIPALVMLVLTTISLYICLGVSFKRLYARGGVLKREGFGAEIWLVRVLVHNGLATYAAWVTIATLINLNVVLTYSAGVTEHISSTVALSFLLLAIISWFFLDNFVFDKYVRYTLTPYFVVIFALIGSIVQNWDIRKSNSALTAFILATSCTAAVCKIVMMLLRHVKRPLFTDNFFPSSVFYGSTSNSKDTVLFADDREFN